MDKKSLTEADIRSKFIDPAINAKGWTEDMILREKYITDGREIFLDGLMGLYLCQESVLLSIKQKT